MTTTAPASDGEGGCSGLWRTVKRLTASPLIYVGAVTVVAGIEIASRLPLSEFWQALALLPIALVLLYGQVAALVWYRRWRGQSVGEC